MVTGAGLLRAREDSGYRQEQVAAALGVSRAMISYWETGQRQPNDRQLVALSRLYRTPVEQLSGSAEPPPRDQAANMLFRGTTPTPADEAKPGLRAFEAFLDAYARLVEVMDVDIHGMQQSPFLGAAATAGVNDARRKAEEVRAYLRIGLGPVADADAVCDLLGITVYRASLGTDLSTTISGAFYRHDELGFSILVNLDMTAGRRRFTVAQELAHALFHSRKARFVVSSAPHGTKDPKERFADAFAGEFLMPTEGIRRLMEELGIGPRITEPSDVIHIQRYFNVSYATALVRLRQAKIVDQDHYEEFKSIRPVMFARALGYDTDDEEIAPDPTAWRIRRFPGRFLRLLRGAVRTEAISVPTAAELTGLSIDDVTDLVGDKVGTSKLDQREIAEFEATGVPG